jgi:MFS family permease
MALNAPALGIAIAPAQSAKLRWTVLGLLALIYACNVADRLILPILAESIRKDLVLSDWALGLLVGPAISFFYAILSIPMAYVADRVNRVRFLALCLALWSVLTALGGAAANALHLGLTRIGVSAMEAGGSPASSSLLADYFRVTERPFAMGIYASAASIAILLCFTLGGFGNDTIGWRWTLVAAGVPGIVLAALLLLIVPEPVRGAHDVKPSAGRDDTPQSLLRSLGALWRNRFFRRVALAVGVSNFCFIAVLSWGPSLVMRKFFAGAGHAGVSLGIGIGLCGALVNIIGGRVVSKLAVRGIGIPLRIAAVLQLLSAPVAITALFAPNLPVCVVLLCVAFGLQAFFTPLWWSISQSHVPPNLRALAAAVALLSAAVFGTALAAPVIGAISDYLKPVYGSASLQYAMAIATVVNLVTAFLFWHAARVAPRHDDPRWPVS